MIPFKRHKNRPNGIGFYNFLKEHVIHLNDKRRKIARFLYNLVLDKAKWLKQTMPMRSGLKEYFDKEFNVDLRLWKERE